MITLLLDTAKDDLNIGLLQDDQLIINYSQPAKQKQSEITMPVLQQLLTQHQLTPKQINQIVITQGPGSFTGLRIAMTIAKVLAAFTPIQLFTLNTLEVLCGKTKQPTMSIMDARGNRAYIMVKDENNEVLTMGTYSLEQAKMLYKAGMKVTGDGHLLGIEPTPIDFIVNMVDLQSKWQVVSDVDQLVPLYLKDNSDYGN